MSSTEKTKKPLLPSRLLHAIFLIAIIILSSFAVLLFWQNQSLQKDSEDTTLNRLSWLAEDVSRRIHLFTGEYESEVWDSARFTISYPDNASQAYAISEICHRIDTVAQQTYYDFWIDMGRIVNLDSQSNHVAYHNISETIRVALGQVDQLVNNVNIDRLELPTLLMQLYNMTGLNSNIYNIGLNGIAYSFSLLSDWWGDEASGQSHSWEPSLQTSLNFALANATALYGQLTTWSSYRNPLDYDFSLQVY
jgi:hypothetical protein